MLDIGDDPTKWELQCSVFVDHLINHHKEQDIINIDFSKSERQYGECRRHCSQNLFFKRKINGESIRRHWIFYSESLGRMFCFYCVLFSEKRSISFVVGFNDWKHSELISAHEASHDHCEAARILSKRSSEISSLQSLLLKQVKDETNYWREVLKRILSVIRFLSSRGLAFRGTNQQIGSLSNGNFLGLIELLAEYDPFLQSHIDQYANKGKGHVSYLSANIANEFIHLLAVEVNKKIISNVQISKYYSLIIDSTPDVSHVDQLTSILRYVDEIGLSTERFLHFFENTGHKGIAMKDAVLKFLLECGIEILDCRGQSYDNARNMSGKYKGLQQLIQQINDLAIYVPCNNHSLNLSIVHSAETSSAVIQFFMFTQNIYVFFSASTQRWDILMKHLKNDLLKRNNKNERLLVPKRLSDTRWSARSSACRALKAGYGSFAAGLKEIFENNEEKKVIGDS